MEFRVGSYRFVMVVNQAAQVKKQLLFNTTVDHLEG
jgi:hypothetical protein